MARISRHISIETKILKLFNTGILTWVLLLLPGLWRLDRVQPLWNLQAPQSTSLPGLSEVHTPHGPPLSLVRPSHTPTLLLFQRVACFEPILKTTVTTVTTKIVAVMIVATRPTATITATSWWLYYYNKPSVTASVFNLTYRPLIILPNSDSSICLALCVSGSTTAWAS